MKSIVGAIIFVLVTSAGSSQNLPYSKIYADCLNADVRSAIVLLEPFLNDSVSKRDRDFIFAFSARFRQQTDTSSLLSEKETVLGPVLSIYHEYWRMALLEPSINYDSTLARNLSLYLSEELQLTEPLQANDSQLDKHLKAYVESKNLLTTGYAKTGKLYDLLVWRDQKDTTYTFDIDGERIQTKVVFLHDFITLGWQEYATLGRCYPGGWATTDALFCVRKSYDLKSENFLISYLCHEARHFSDFRKFPHLTSADLEYRAKLTELGMLESNLFSQLEFFINNASAESENGHAVANYYVIRNLSKSLFNTDFENNVGRWKQLGQASINNASRRLLKENSRVLKRAGRSVTSVLKRK